MATQLTSLEISNRVQGKLKAMRMVSGCILTPSLFHGTFALYLTTAVTLERLMAGHQHCGANALVQVSAMRLEASVIPYFQLGYLNLGVTSIAWFHVFVAGAVLCGYLVSRWRAKREGLDPVMLTDMVLDVVLIGFVGSHLVAVLTEAPAMVREDPFILLQLWKGMSSLGGMVGALLALVWFGWRRGLSWIDTLRYLDVLIYGFSFAWLLGRTGCLVTHDHIGPPTTFWLGISLETELARQHVGRLYPRAGMELGPEPTAFHDLGWYELLYTMLVIVPLMVVLGRRRRPPGMLVVAFMLAYAPVRIALDTLRVTDSRWLGVTVAQWLCGLLLVITSVFVYRQYRRQPEANDSGIMPGKGRNS